MSEKENWAVFENVDEEIQRQRLRQEALLEAEEEERLRLEDFKRKAELERKNREKRELVAREKRLNERYERLVSLDKKEKAGIIRQFKEDEEYERERKKRISKRKINWWLWILLLALGFFLYEKISEFL